ncbi:FUSC family protein [Enterococcus mediterraneensis]|uniref:FUSC family protein n=1 Tax=Enterococcus mediterraneensis TaxID=2364791 RepID=UPI000F066FAB|nr:aromatic acid exporter family protein [Enterococcus mediterraneensis]
MYFGRFRIGMRTMKTALAVMLCILLFEILDRGVPLIAALSAVFSLRQDLTTTVSFGRSRILGNTIGGAAAIFYFFIKQYFRQDFLVELFILPILVAVVIIISDGINNNTGIVAAIATMLLIALSVPQGESFLYAVQRVIDTFIGTFIAISINFVIRPPEQEKEQQITEDLEELKKKKTELESMLSEIQKKIEKSEDDPL